MATPIELLQGALIQLRQNNTQLVRIEQQLAVLTAQLAVQAQRIQALEQGDGDCAVGGTPT